MKHVKIYVAITIAAIFIITVIFTLVNIEHFSSRYADLVITIIGSCIGFGLAIIGSRVIEYFNDERRIIIAKKNIEEELKFICEKLFYPNGSSEITDTKLYFDTPIWSSVISTGDILKIRKHEKFYRATLASYRRLELLQEDEIKIDWDNINQEERQKIIAVRRDVLRFVNENHDEIAALFKKHNNSKNRKAEIEDVDFLKELKKRFRLVANDKMIPNDNTFLSEFGGRDIKKKGFFFYTALLKKAFPDNAMYGIGFGEYDCEIYLNISIDKINIGDSELNKYFSYLDYLDSIKTEDIYKTQYTFKKNKKVSINYSRIVLAGSHYKKGCTRKTISDDTIKRMLGELQEFENKWLIPLLNEKP